MFDLSRPILIHVCKDRTLTYRNRKQPVFNGVALPVFSVNDVDEARLLIRTVSNKQYTSHPLIPGDDWYKIDMGPHIQYLELSDLQSVEEKLSSVYETIAKCPKEHTR